MNVRNAMHFKSDALPIGNGAGRTGVDFALERKMVAVTLGADGPQRYALGKNSC